MKLVLLFICGLLSLKAYSLDIKGIDLRTDKEVEVKIKKDKPSVYYFLSAWCPCSQGTFDHLNELQKKFKDFSFVGFQSSVVIPKQAALKYFGKYKIDFPVIFDPKVKYADHFKALKTPHVFVYGADNKLLFQGGATNSKDFKKATKFYLKEALQAISDGKKPPLEHAKALGCYIQRS